MIKKGIALVTTIMILLVLTLLATGLMFTIKNETAISIYQAHNVASVQVAEAALDEVKYRMKLNPTDAGFIGDTSIPLDTAWTTYIILNPREDTSGSVIYTQTLQKNISDPVYSSSDPELNYSSDIGAGGADDATLKIYHKKNAAGDQIYFFDSQSQRQFLGPPSLVSQYPPVEIVEITAKVGKAEKKIIAELSKYTLEINAQSALSATSFAWDGVGAGQTQLCGHNHKLSTPWGTVPIPGLFPPTPFSPTEPDTTDPNSCWYQDPGTGEPVYHVMTRFDSTEHPTYNHFLWNPTTNSLEYEHIEFDEYCSEMGCVAALATKGAAAQIHGAGTQTIFGNPDVIVRSEITIPNLWDMLGYSSKSEMLSDPSMNWQDDLTNYSGTGEWHNYHLKNSSGLVYLPRDDNTTTYTHGIVYIDDTMSFAPGGGPMTCGFYHKGLVYVEYDAFTDTANAGGAYTWWLLGAMMVKGDMYGKKAGTTEVNWLYSSQALKNTVEETKSYYKILGWKEEN